MLCEKTDYRATDPHEGLALLWMIHTLTHVIKAHRRPYECIEAAGTYTRFKSMANKVSIYYINGDYNVEGSAIVSHNFRSSNCHGLGDELN